MKYNVSYTLVGSIQIDAVSEDDARDQAEDMSFPELGTNSFMESFDIDYIDKVNLKK